MVQHAKTLNADNAVAIKLLVLANLFLFLSIIAIFARIYSRHVTRQKFVFSDYAIFLGLFFTATIDAGQITACILGGVGAPVKITTMKHLFISMETYKFVWLLWAAAITCIRLSILHFLHTIFHQSKFTRWGSIILSLCSMLFFIGIFIDFLALCRPFSYDWHRPPPEKCGNRQLGPLLATIFNLVLDLCLITLPMPALWKLKMPLRKKIGLVLIFGVGTVICGITIIRIWSVKHYSTKESKMNWTVTIFGDAVLSSIEPSLGIINACLPFLPALSQHISSSRVKRMNWIALKQSTRSYKISTNQGALSDEAKSVNSHLGPVRGDDPERRVMS